MKYAIDHDYHIHSQLSSCSSDPGQTTGAILDYARKNKFRQICLTDHFWDADVPGASEWYAAQDFAHVSQALPLPQSPDCRFLFGCEGEMDKFRTMGIGAEKYGKFDFMIVPTNHLHMRGFTIEIEDCESQERRATLCAERFGALLDSGMPLGKMGVAHLTCSLLAGGGGGKYKGEHIDIIDLIPDEKWGGLFSRAAKLGLGIELNMGLKDLDDDQLRRMFRPYFIARECGCKFYLGSDAHHPGDLEEAPARFEAMVSFLQLEEKDKYHIPGAE